MSLPAAPAIVDYWRYELKYRLTCLQYQQVKNALQPFLRLDPHSEAVSSRRYLVRSLYFDSLDYQSYNEKLGGNRSRYKFRIRTYSTDQTANPVIRVEAKLRDGGVTQKLGTFVSVAQYCHFMEHYHWDCETNPILVEFERNLHSRVLRPKVLVEYLREGYQSRENKDIRITFDHKIHSAQARSLFPEHPFFRQHDAHLVVLEIKHRSAQPGWLRSIVQTYNLKIEPNSKYCQGIEVTQLDLVNHALRV